MDGEAEFQCLRMAAYANRTIRETIALRPCPHRKVRHAFAESIKHCHRILTDTCVDCGRVRVRHQSGWRPSLIWGPTVVSPGQVDWGPPGPAHELIHRRVGR